MNAFAMTLEQMLFLFLCILIGFALNRGKVLPAESDVVISRLESYVFVPAMVLNSFRTYCTGENLRANAGGLVFSIVMLGIYAALACLLAPRFAANREEEGIYRYALAITNYGFMGNSIVQGLLGDAMLFRYLIMTIPAGIFCYSAGIIWITAGRKKFSPKMLINPMFIGMLIGMVLGLTHCPLPGFVNKTVSACAGCFSPVAMVLTGYVIGKFEIPGLFLRKNVYWLTGLRLVLLPLACLGICRLLKIDADITALAVVFSSMPLGLNTIVFPAAYGGDETLGASMAVISNLIGMATVPLILALAL